MANCILLVSGRIIHAIIVSQARPLFFPFYIGSGKEKAVWSARLVPLPLVAIDNTVVQYACNV